MMILKVWNFLSSEFILVNHALHIKMHLRPFFAKGGCADRRTQQKFTAAFVEGCSAGKAFLIINQSKVTEAKEL